MAEFSEKELFETVPVPTAVAALAIPTVISQVVTMIYNLADTFFIGQIGNPHMVAAVSLVSPWFNLLTALGNLFGLGGSSLISRMLGVKQENKVRYVSAFSVWAGAAVTACFSLASFAARRPLLAFLGASPDTYGYAEDYLFWVVVLGGGLLQMEGFPRAQLEALVHRYARKPYPERNLRLCYSRPNQQNGPVGAAIYARKRMADAQYL